MVDMVEPAHTRGAGEFPVNGEVIAFNDPIIEIREALNRAGLTPASEHQVILVEKRRTHLMQTEDKLTLAEHPQGYLRAFRSGESSSFTVDEIQQVWGTEEMETDEFYSIWSPPRGHDWVLERSSEPDIVLRPGSTINFGPKGVEHIVSRPHHGAEKVLVTVLTLSGVFPAEGALRVDSTETIASILDKAAKKLELASTSNWVVSVGGRDIVPSQTFAQANLSGTIEIDWMPREGGGGHA